MCSLELLMNTIFCVALNDFNLQHMTFLDDPIQIWKKSYTVSLRKVCIAKLFEIVRQIYFKPGYVVH